MAFFDNHGFCVTCEKDVIFSSTSEWFRDEYLCNNCGSLPRERALMWCIEKFCPQWKGMAIHESSPAQRGASTRLASAKRYVASQYYPDYPIGQTLASGIKCENLEKQTFSDGMFDLVVTQDVMEHIFEPALAFSEIARTLKKGGFHICTVPLVNKNNATQICARRNHDNNIIHYTEPEYHGNPIDSSGSLVTMRWGYDISEFIFKNSGMTTTIAYIDDLSKGIRAEYIEVLICRKL